MTEGWAASSPIPLSVRSCRMSIHCRRRGPYRRRRHRSIGAIHSFASLRRPDLYLIDPWPLKPWGPAPTLRQAFGVAPDTAAEMLVVFGDNPERVHSDAAFAELCGACPVPANSSMSAGRHRLHRGGHRQANAPLYRSVIVRMRFHEPTMPILPSASRRRRSSGSPPPTDRPFRPSLPASRNSSRRWASTPQLPEELFGLLAAEQPQYHVDLFVGRPPGARPVVSSSFAPAPS